MRFHPENKVKVAKWHVVHAVSDNKDGKGVLVTAHEVRGGKDDEKHGPGYDPARHNEHHHILGDIRDGTQAKALAESLTQFKCEKQYPEHNCVDWTKKAIDHLHEKGVIEDDKHEHFTKLYEDNQATVREKTNTAPNRDNTFGEEHRPKAGPSK